MKGSYRSGGFLMLWGKREMMCPSVVSGCCIFPHMKTNKRSYRVGGFGMFFWEPRYLDVGCFRTCKKI